MRTGADNPNLIQKSLMFRILRRCQPEGRNIVEVVKPSVRLWCKRKRSGSRNAEEEDKEEGENYKGMVLC